MSNKFNQFIKNGILINIGLLLLGIVVFMGYLDEKELEFSDLGMNGDWHISIDDNDFVNFTPPSYENDSSSKYETKTIHQEDVFEVKNNIIIESTIESIEFIHEDRDDIKVVFDREQPDTSKYRVSYSANESSNRINIRANMTVTNLFFNDKSYTGTIKIYVPMDYDCDTLTIESAFAEMDNMIIPNRVDNLIINADVADVSFDIYQPLDTLSVNVNAGSLDITTHESIEEMKVSCDSSSTTFEIFETIDTLTLETNVGAIDGSFHTSPRVVDLNSDLGDIHLSFYDYVNTLDVNADLADIDIDVLENDDALVYNNTEFSDFNSDLDTTSKRTEAQITINMDLGSVDIDSVN